MCVASKIRCSPSSACFAHRFSRPTPDALLARLTLRFLLPAPYPARKLLQMVLRLCWQTLVRFRSDVLAAPPPPTPAAVAAGDSAAYRAHSAAIQHELLYGDLPPGPGVAVSHDAPAAASAVAAVAMAHRHHQYHQQQPSPRPAGHVQHTDPGLVDGLSRELAASRAECAHLSERLSEVVAQLAGSNRRAADAEASLRRWQGEPAALKAMAPDALAALVSDAEAALGRMRGAHAAALVEREASCPVCWDAKKGLVFQCGHQACIGCGERLAACPICRAVVTLRIKLF